MKVAIVFATDGSNREEAVLGPFRSAGFFEAAFPLPEKPFSQVKRGQKTRARARRAWSEWPRSHPLDPGES